MRSILFWILPPLVGALIGYVTNALAIKMLFRPLREIRLFGLRLPFTPGILPRERHKLADSIGGMVERELLTAEVLRERLASTEVHERVQSAMACYTDTLLKRPLASWLDDSPGALRGRGPSLGELLGTFVNSDVFNSFLEELIGIWAGVKYPQTDEESDFGSRIKFQLSAIFVPATRDLIKSGLIKELKSRARGEKSVYRHALENIIKKYPGITLGEFLSVRDSQKRRIDYFLTEKAAAAAGENIDEMLVSLNVKTLVSDRINSLDMIRVENIILDVMAGQLKWINFFGAVLGALIGFVQVILSLLTR